MVMYNLTDLQEATNVVDLVSYANTSTDGVMVMLFVFAIFFVMLMISRRYGFTEGIVTSSFLSFIISSLFTYGKLLNILVPLLFLALTAFTAMYLYIARRQ